MYKLISTYSRISKENITEIAKEGEKLTAEALKHYTELEKEWNNYKKSFWIQNPWRTVTHAIEAATTPLFQGIGLNASPGWFAYAHKDHLQIVDDLIFSKKIDLYREQAFFCTQIATYTDSKTPNLIKRALITISTILAIADTAGNRKAEFLAPSVEAKLIEQYCNFVKEANEHKEAEEASNNLMRVQKIKYLTPPENWIKGVNWQQTDGLLPELQERLAALEQIPSVQAQRLKITAGDNGNQRRYEASIKGFDAAYKIIESKHNDPHLTGSTAKLATSFSCMTVHMQAAAEYKLYHQLKKKEHHITEADIWCSKTLANIQAYMEQEKQQGIAPTYTYKSLPDIVGSFACLHTNSAKRLTLSTEIAQCLKAQADKTPQIHLKNKHRQNALEHLAKGLETYKLIRKFMVDKEEYYTQDSNYLNFFMGHYEKEQIAITLQTEIQKELDDDKAKEKALENELKQKETEAQAAETELKDQIEKEALEALNKAQETLEKAVKKEQKPPPPPPLETPPSLQKTSTEGANPKAPTPSKAQKALDTANKAIMEYAQTKTNGALEVAGNACKAAQVQATEEEDWLTETQAYYQDAHRLILRVIVTYPPTEETIQEHRDAQELLEYAFRSSDRIESEKLKKAQRDIIKQLQKDNHEYLNNQLERIQKAEEKLNRIEEERQAAIERFGGIKKWCNNPNIETHGLSEKTKASQAAQKKLTPIAKYKTAFEEMKKQSEGVDFHAFGIEAFAMSTIDSANSHGAPRSAIRSKPC